MSLFGDGLELLKLVDKGRNAPLYGELGKWIEKVEDLQTENSELSAENAALREQLRLKQNLERIDGHLFMAGDDEEICPRCAEVDSRAVHLMMMDHKLLPGFRATCPSCKTTTQYPRPATRRNGIVHHRSAL